MSAGERRCVRARAAEEEETVLADDWCTSFTAVVKRRALVYANSKRTLFCEVCVPALLMVLGIAVTGLEHVGRSESRILAPDRIDYPGQLLMLDSHKNADLFSQLMQNASNGYLDVRVANKTHTVPAFEQFVYDWGRQNAPEMPYFYAAYKLGRVDLE